MTISYNRKSCVVNYSQNFVSLADQFMNVLYIDKPMY